MELKVIGCSGSFPSASSPASSYLVTVTRSRDQWRLLLDVGSGSVGPLQSSVCPHELDAVLLTHLHPDHFFDLYSLAVARRWNPYCAAAGPLPVWGPKATYERLAAACSSEPEPLLAETFTFHRWAAQEPITMGPLIITPFPVEHPVPEAYALRLEYRTEDGRVRILTYSGDTDSCDGLVAAAKDADLFLCEASFIEGRDQVRQIHLTGKRAGEAAAQAKARRLVLTHIPPWTDGSTVWREARDALEDAGLGCMPVELAEPGNTYSLLDRGCGR